MKDSIIQYMNDKIATGDAAFMAHAGDFLSKSIMSPIDQDLHNSSMPNYMMYLRIAFLRGYWARFQQALQSILVRAEERSVQHGHKLFDRSGR